MDNEKVHINIVVIGHFDSGKSTTAGHLIYKLEGIDKSVFEKETPETNKYAWVLDKLKAERERGIKNDDIALSMFETTKYYFTVAEAPYGHSDFLKNIVISHCAILLIDSTTSSYDAETRLHARFASTYGLEQMICCCNKMDATTPKYSKDRFEEIVNKFSPFFMSLGFNRGDIPFVPISGFEGDNLIEPSTNLGWYNGPTLLETLDQIKPTLSKYPGAADFSVANRIHSMFKRHNMLKEEFGHVSTEERKKEFAELESIMEEYKRGIPGWEHFMLSMPTKFKEAMKEVSCMPDKQKDDFISRLKKNAMLTNNRNQVAEQYAPKDGDLSKNQREEMKIQQVTRTGSGYNTRSKGVSTFQSL